MNIENKKTLDQDSSLRPRTLDEYIGQEHFKDNLKVYLKAAKSRNEVLDHTLFYGPPGLGKTTLAYIIANEMNGKIHCINGPSIERIGDLAAILSIIEPGDILFIDEIHRLPKNTQEVLYSVMEDFKLITVVNNGSSSSNIEIDIPPFTLVGATTNIGLLSLPLTERFGIIEKLNYYTSEEIKEIAKRTGRVLNIEIKEEAALIISNCSKGTPRIANRLIKRIRDFAHYENTNEISIQITKKTLKSLGIEENGLDKTDIRYLNCLINDFNSGPVGAEALTSTLGEELNNIIEYCEPYLLKIGFINRTRRGRVATEKAKMYLNSIKIT